MDLIADIGASWTRCARLDDQGRVQAVEVYRNADFSGVDGVLQRYLVHRAEHVRPTRAALAVAAPILSDDVQMVNIDWGFSQAALGDRFGLAQLTVVNDFAAIAWGLAAFTAVDLQQVGGGAPVPRTPLTVLGPGSGLGMATLVPGEAGWAVAGGEGGNASVAPSTPEEWAVVEFVRAQHGHCSAENLLSGPGLVTVYRALAKIRNRPAAAQISAAQISAAQISAAATAGDPLASGAQDMFFEVLGSTAGNLALTVGATGGVFIAGGIIPRLLEPFLKSRFRARFEAKGRYRGYLEAIPTYVITDPLPAFRGLRNLLGYPSARSGET